ncbi:2-hydroxy-3-keto-5-methylthiopentenyl-1-phosphate phosphatase [Bacillus pinisoli]|uniref:2-hydroxy-3-keto-5-methylthiopentenyl-1- phosphate phosphatase n=1 Tax=Bacillus pinisoli TaxID=2901866 RepID=UPI001FF2B185|nr:2-hydroxy-3-keto-5-methylthiopentenyl-1-phosphate phosphatase [Bacillus pinisoli]
MNQIIFCDFDGTITETDNIISLMKQFAPPEWNSMKDQILSQEISIQEGVGKMFSLLPSSIKDDIIHYLKETAIIREGFSDFVQFTKEEEIELFIVSGGIDFFVYPLLEGLISKEFIFCNASDFSNEKIQVLWPNSCDESCDNGCGCCKPSLIKKLAQKEDHVIVIGDSITDLQAAKQADTVFARDFLKEKLTELNIPFQPFETFYDVIHYLKEQKVINV